MSDNGIFYLYFFIFFLLLYKQANEDGNFRKGFHVTEKHCADYEMRKV